MGGAATVINEVLERADRSRHQPVLVCLSRGQWPELARSHGIPAYSLPRTRLRSPRNLLQVVGGLRRIIKRERIDLVHASENTALLYAGLAARTTGTPFVWHVHSPLQPRSREERIVARVLPRLRPDHVVFTSPGAQARSIDLGWDDSSVVFPGVDIAARRSGDAARGREALGIPTAATVVSMFARVVPEKGAATFIDSVGAVAARRPDLWGVLCGPGDTTGPFWGRLREKLRDFGVDERVLMPGDVRPPLRDDVLAMSDVVLHTSPAEAFGLAVLEAMAAGKPVVAAASDGPRLLLDDGALGVLVPPEDTNGFVEALSALLDDPERRADLGRRAADAAARFPIEQTVRRIEDVWDQVLRRRLPGVAPNNGNHHF